MEARGIGAPTDAAAVQEWRKKAKGRLATATAGEPLSANDMAVLAKSSATYAALRPLLLLQNSMRPFGRATALLWTR